MKKNILLIVMCSFLSLENSAQTILDIDGNIYNTVEIGTQTWMQENLKTTRFNDGVEISTTTLPTNNNTSAIYQWAYNYDSINVDIYGRLYTWYVVNSDKNVCPVGWHVPSYFEWEILIDFLGGDSIAGAVMKDTGTIHWAETNSAVDNSSGFTGLGSGFRGNPSGFIHLDARGHFWSSTMLGTNDSFPRGHSFRLSAENNSVQTGVAVANCGMAIRCIKDDITSGLNNSPSKKQFQLFPNPAKERITISTQQKGSYDLFIYDMLGNTLYMQNVVGNINEVDIEFLPKGSYFIQIIAKDYKATEKFIKQ